MKNEKAKLRLLDAIERLRKTLSANSDAQISIECLMEDEDLHYMLKREDLEALCEPMAVKIRETLLALKQQLDTKKIAYSDVEIVGGGTRIPFVQRQIQEVFGVAGVQRTLNASESVARGCALMAAMMSPLFRVAEYQVDEYNLYPIRASWQFESEMEIENDTKNTGILFAEGCSIPSFKSISFPKAGNFILSLFYDKEIEGVNKLLAEYKL
jgi:heat shock protein 4